MSDLQEGNRLYVQRRFAEAIAAYLRHAEACPDDAAKSYALAARCCPPNPRGKIPSPPAVLSPDTARTAEDFCRLSLSIDPNHFAALKQLAMWLPSSSPERVSVLERAAALRDDDLLLVELGDHYRSIAKDLERAYATYLRAQQAFPKDQTAYRRLSELCRRSGKIEEAKLWNTRWKEVDATRYKHRR
jgi:tetratricopeptide (TPR) repeat protein